MDDGLKDFKKYIERVEDIISYIDSLDGQEIKADNKDFIEGGSFIHQDTEESTAEESADFEKNNPEIFKKIRAIIQKIENAIAD